MTSISRVSLASTPTWPTPGDARERRPDHVEGVVVELGSRERAGEVQRRRWETPPASADRRPDSMSAGRLAADLGDAVLHHLQRDDGVGARLELRRNLGRAAKRPRSHAPDARHLHDRLFERAGHGQRHRAGGRAARVRDDDDARKLEGRIDAARQAHVGDRAGRARQRP